MVLSMQNITRPSLPSVRLLIVFVRSNIEGEKSPFSYSKLCLKVREEEEPTGPISLKPYRPSLTEICLPYHRQARYRTVVQLGMKHSLAPLYFPV